MKSGFNGASCSTADHRRVSPASSFGGNSSIEKVGRETVGLASVLWFIAKQGTVTAWILKALAG